MADTDRYKRATERRLVDYLGANVRVLVLAAAALDLVSCNADMRPIGRQTEDGGASDSGTMVDSGGGFIPCGLGDLRMPDAAQASERQCGDAPRVLIHLADETPECGPGSGQTAPLIAVNASHVYFPLQWLVPIPNEAGSLQGYLLRVPIEGGHAERIAPVPSGAAHSVRGLALTSTDVLFIRAPIELGGNAAIVSVPLWLAPLKR